MALPFLTFLLILAAVGIALYLGLPYPMALKLLRPPRMTDGKAMYLLKRLSPGDLAIPFEEVSFDIEDLQSKQPMTIAGWWMPQLKRSDRTVLLLHGYADAKVGSIAWAPLFRSLGYHVCAIDLRAHGGSSGLNVTAGYWERHDVAQVIDQLKARYPHETRNLVLFGISLGAAVAIATAAIRDDLAACILESPYSDYDTAVHAHADLMGMPGPSFVRRALRMAERISGAKFDEVAPARLIPQAKCPVLVISAGADPLVGTSVTHLEKSVSQRADASAHWNVTGAYHVESMHGDYDEYTRRIADFLAETDVVARASRP